MHWLIAATLTLGAVQANEDVYKVTLIRAAPGHLMDVIDRYRGRMAEYDRIGEERPILMRHSQGDHWDLMIVTPVGTLASHFSSERSARWRGAAGGTDREFHTGLQPLVAWKEETYFSGPPVETAGPLLRDAGFYHIEMFVAWPGKYDELYREREMENDYLVRLDRRPNLIFRKLVGGSWDMATIGMYRNLLHYAESGNQPAERQNAAAIAAGFDGVDTIGTYLRELLSRHNDTLANAVR